MRLIFLVLLIAESETVLCYPQTIVHGYSNCSTCHLTSDGGDVLNNYGRAMTEEFMATFAREGEAREFFGLAETDFLDLGVDYRSMRIQDADTGTSDQFHMYSVAQLALRHAGLSLFGSTGYFGRDRIHQTRNYGVGYHVDIDAHSLDFKLGYWIPAIGIQSNNHDLSIKKANGFGRGQEKFIGQVSWLNRWFESKVMITRSDINIVKNEDNFPKNDSKDKPEVIWDVKFKRIEKFEFGVHARIQDGIQTLLGHSIRISKGHAYIFLQQDFDQSKEILTAYGRFGFYPVRGLDLYFEHDQFENSLNSDIRRSIGFSWMIRPRFEYEGSGMQWGQRRFLQTSLKLWL